MTGSPLVSTRRGARAVAALSAVAGWLAISAACEPYQPLPRAQTFVIQGAHEALDCVECHGAGPPFSAFVWDTTCLQCHEPDRALHPNQPHNPGLGCAATGGCHSDTDLLWSDALNHDFLPLEGAHALPGGCTPCHDAAAGVPAATNVIPATGDPDKCASCHEDRRLFDGHYEFDASPGEVGAISMDCKPCHDASARVGAPFGVDWRDDGAGGRGWHLSAGGNIIRIPHGIDDNGVPQPSTEWVTACAACHPSGPPGGVTPIEVQCSVACHAEIFAIAPHTSFTPGSGDTSCASASCHPHADIRNSPAAPDEVR